MTREIHVAPSGSDATGTGSEAAPYATPEHALRHVGPGDTVFLRPGIYAPFTVPVSGEAGRPITVTSKPEHRHLAVIDGDLRDHRAQGGNGVPPLGRNPIRDGIRIAAKDHVRIRGLRVCNVSRHGIFVVGAEGEQHGHHVIADNVIHTVGRGGIFAGGNNSDSIIPLGETAARLVDVVIEGNDVSETNLETDYGGWGNVEAITGASSLSGIVIRFNSVHDTRGYGIDLKAGVRGGAVYGNRVWNVEKYGIYLDAGRRFVEDVEVYANHVWNCRLGIVLAREAGSNTVDYGAFRAQLGAAEFVQSLARIDVSHNMLWGMRQAAIFCQRHPQKDGPDGRVEDVRIRANTVFCANRDGPAHDLNLSGWADPDFREAGVVSGFEFSGNVIGSDVPLSIRDDFTGQPGFSVSDDIAGP